MHLLILGFSSIVRRRVLPAARAVTAIRRISVASRSHGGQPGAGDVTWFADYDEALASSGADAVYVSGPNAGHGAWVERALTRGCHVAVDKPALPDLDSANAMAALARRRRKGLAEAVVFAYHPQIAQLKALIAASDPGFTRVTATFSVPPLPPTDFRYRAACGGGSLFDLGPYAVAANRLIFGAPPASITCQVLTRTGRPAVDTSFSALFAHEHGGAMTGHFGFVTAYENRVSVLTPSCSIEIERVFTTPPDAAGSLRLRDAGGERFVTTHAADAFALFLRAFAQAIDRSEFDAFESALLADATLLQRLRQAAGV